MSELEKMKAVKDRSQNIGEFLDWLATEKHYIICQVDNDDQFMPVRMSIESLLADYFEIDLNKVEKEKQAILDELREKNRAS